MLGRLQNATQRCTLTLRHRRWDIHEHVISLPDSDVKSKQQKKQESNHGPENHHSV
jgi:hypothetical protein